MHTSRWFRCSIAVLGSWLAVACLAQTALPAQASSSSAGQPPLLPAPAAQSVPAMARDHHYALLALTALSDKHPKPERLAAIGALTRLAEHGNAFAEYVLGSQYMWGAQRPHALLPYNAALASEYLANAAIRGNLYAMQALAQFDLLNHHPLQAMIWAQTLAYYHHQLNPEQQRMHGYLPELIARAQRQLSDAQKAAVLGDVNGVIARYGARIEKGLHDRGMPQPSLLCLTRRIAPPANMPAFPTPDFSGRYPHAVSLIMLYAVDPAGRIADHAIINMLPDWRVHNALNHPLALMRFNATPYCHHLRPVTQPVEYDDRRYTMHWH
ncbi:hypothetical protein [Metallibacterium scheffleri]